MRGSNLVNFFGGMEPNWKYFRRLPHIYFHVEFSFKFWWNVEQKGIFWKLSTFTDPVDLIDYFEKRPALFTVVNNHVWSKIAPRKMPSAPKNHLQNHNSVPGKFWWISVRFYCLIFYMEYSLKKTFDILSEIVGGYQI